MMVHGHFNHNLRSKNIMNIRTLALIKTVGFLFVFCVGLIAFALVAQLIPTYLLVSLISLGLLILMGIIVYEHTLDGLKRKNSTK
jgi:cytochrome c biogenesis protein CcdA